jgi:DNA invertase Pin-like site-specific DNA recombinase
MFILQSGIDTTTPAGKAMYQMMGVFSEFERSMIQSRIKAGLARARANPRKGARAIGRPKVVAAVEKAILERLAAGMGILKIAAELRVGSGTVQRVKRASTAA